MSVKILLVEDEPGLVLTLSDLLSAEGYDVEAEADGPGALSKALASRYDLIILDVMLPGKSGFEVCKELRAHGVDSAILMLTARTQVNDRVLGLKIGADDYLTKPFDPSELAARVEALLRRVQKENPPLVTRFQFDDVEIDFERAEARKGGRRIQLSGKEFELLRYLIHHRGRVVSRDELLKYVWQYQESVTSRTVDVHIAWLRQKLEDNPQLPRRLHTVRGVGYRFAP